MKKIPIYLKITLLLISLLSFRLIASAQTYGDTKVELYNINKVLDSCRQLEGSCEKPAVDSYCRNQLAGEETNNFQILDAYALTWKKSSRQPDNTRKLISVECQTIHRQG